MNTTVEAGGSVELTMPLPGDQEDPGTVLLASLVSRGFLSDDLETRQGALGVIDKALADADHVDGQLGDLIARIQDMEGDLAAVRGMVENYRRRRLTEGREA